MRKSLKAILVALVLISSISFRVAADDVVIMTEDWPPYNYQDGDEITGFSTEIVRLIMIELGEDYPIVILPAARSEKYLVERPNHLFFTFFRTPERENNYKWVGPLARDEVYFYKKKGSTIVINSITDINVQGLTVVSLQEGMVHTRLKSAGIEKLIDKARTFKNVLLMHHKGRGELIATNPLSVRYDMEAAGLDPISIERTPVLLFANDLYIAFSKMTDTAIVNRWNKALVKVKTTDKYQHIKQNYLGDL